MSTTLAIPVTGKLRRRDVRWRGLLLLLLGVLLLGLAIKFWPEPIGKPPGPTAVASAPISAADPFASLQSESATARERRELAAAEAAVERPSTPGKAKKPAGPLDVAAKMIKERKYDEALELMNAQRESLIKQPETFVLLGRALEGRGDAATARDFYLKAIDMDPFLSDAYWGVATSSERMGEIETALGAMRNFLHTNPDPDPYRLRIAQARSAIWEWESQLGRGPWGPTKGIIPGLTPELARKDPKGGMAIMLPIPGTERPDGSVKFEVKHRAKIKIFERE